MPDQHILPNTFETSEIKRGLDLRETLSFLWRRWKFIGVVAGVVFVIGGVYLVTRTPLYTATAQVLLDQSKIKPPASDAVLSDSDLDVAFVDGQMSIIRSTEFLRRVVEREHLVQPTPSDTAESASQQADSFISSLVSFVTSFGKSAAQHAVAPADAPADVTMGTDSIPAAEINAIEALKGSLNVFRAPQQGYLISISVTSTDPKKAAQLANAVANVYLVDKLDTRFDAAKRASAWLSDRLVGLRDQVKESEEAVAQFRAEHGLVQSGSLTLNQQQLSDLNAKLIDAKTDLAQKKARVDLLNALQAKGASLQSMPDVANAGALPKLREQADTLSTQAADLTARYGASHPLVVNIQAQQRDVERAIAAETARVVGVIRSEYALAQTRVASLQQALQQATGQNNIDDATAIHLRELERTAEVNKTLFEDFLKQAKITQEQSTFEPQNARVITPALPPGGPSYPPTRRFMLITLFLGLGAGVGGALTKEKLNAGFVAPKQVEEMVGLPVLTSVSHLATRDLRVDGSDVAIYDYPIAKPLSRYGEALRALRSGIQMTDVDHPPRVIQVTSTLPGEGKTTIGLSLAASATGTKLKVLFIDADLRHPTATRLLGLQKGLGLVDLLVGEARLEDVIQYHEKGRYWVLGAGSRTQNPNDLLSSARMKAIIEGFRQSYDLVVIDAPPVGLIIDPVIVAQLSDKVVFVVRWGVTARELIRDCVSKIPGHRKVAGIVFNHVNERVASKYSKSIYSHYYGDSAYKKYFES